MSEETVQVNAGAEKNDRLTQKEEKKRQQYLNSMITRKEAFEMLEYQRQNFDMQLAVIYVQVKTLSDLLIKHNITTVEELEATSAEVMNEMQNVNPEAKSDQP